MRNFEINLRRRNVPQVELIDDLKRVAKLLNLQTLTGSIYDEKGKFGKTTILRRFGSWNKALEASELKVVLILNNKEEILFENLANVWKILGRQPVGSDLDKSKGCSKFALGTYEKRFGSWNKALQAFADFINEVSVSGTFSEDVKRARENETARTSRKINWRLRAKVLIRDNCICKMCGASPAKDSAVMLHVDHIKAWSKGGETKMENLQTLCAKCNIGKSDL